MDTHRSPSSAPATPRDGGRVGWGLAVGVVGVAICSAVAVGVLTVRAAVVVSAEATAGFAREQIAATGAGDADAPATTSSAAPSAAPSVMVPVTPTDAPIAGDGPAAADAFAVLADHLTAAGASGFTLSDSWETCGRPDKGPRMIQGCAAPDEPTVIIMKPVDAEVAASEAARGVVLHEWAHVVQFRLGYAAVHEAADLVYGPGVGLEESADCMAIQLGAVGAPGGYTTDCAGARGELAAAFLAGRLG